MPAQKRSTDGHNDAALLHSLCHYHRKPSRGEGAECEAEEEEVLKVEVQVEPPMSQSSPPLAPPPAEEEQQQPEHCAAVGKEDLDSDDGAEEELPEYVNMDLQEIRKEVQCPICLGIIKKTRTMMECLHRFCRECIDKSMRMGNNECPACRTHCASRRSLRDDPRYDALIAALFPNIEKYEKEELALCEEEKTRNKQIQASIAQIFKRQSEALGKNRSPRKGIQGHSPSRLERSNRETSSRRRKRRTGETELEESENYEDLENTEGQSSSYSGEHFKEIGQYRHKTRRRVGSSGPRSPATSSDGGCMENKLEQKRSYHGIMWKMRTWGKSCARSNTRHGSASGPIRKDPHCTHLAKLIEFLRSLEKKDDEHVASETPSGADKQLLAATEPHRSSHNRQGKLHLSSNVDQCQDRLQMPEVPITADIGMPAKGSFIEKLHFPCDWL